MKEDNNINRELQQLRDRFEMNPSDNAWNFLEADLERKQGLLYKQRMNRFKLLSICLALLLFLFISYCYVLPSFEGKSNAITQNENSHNSTGKLNISNKRKELNATSFNTTSNPNKLEKNAFVSGNIRKILNSDSTKSEVTPSNEVKVVTPLNLSSATNTNMAKKKFIVQNSDSKKLENSITFQKRPYLFHTKKNKNRQSENEITNKKQDYNELKTKSFANSIESKNVDNNVIPSSDGLNESSKEKNYSLPIISDSSTEQLVTKSHLQTADLRKKDSSSSDISKSNSTVNKSKRSKSRLSITAFYTPNYISGFHLVDNPSNTDFDKDDYSQKNSTKYSFATGLSFRYDLSKRFAVSIGGTYSTINYSMEVPKLYVRYGLNNKLLYKYPTFCGNIELPNKSNANLKYGDSLVIMSTCQQIVKVLSVPVTTSFQIANSKGFRIYAEAGVSLNFMLEEKAKMAIGSRKYTITNSIDGLQKINYGYLLGVGLEHRFYHSLNLFVVPTLTGSITSLTINTTYKCYPYSVSVRTGLFYHF